MPPKRSFLEIELKKIIINSSFLLVGFLFLLFGCLGAENFQNFSSDAGEKLTVDVASSETGGGAGGDKGKTTSFLALNSSLSRTIEFPRIPRKNETEFIARIEPQLGFSIPWECLGRGLHMALEIYSNCFFTRLQPRWAFLRVLIQKYN